MQDTAAANAAQFGLGFADLIPLELGWVLSWVKVEIDEYPAYADTVLLNTWPKCGHKIYSMRDFQIKNTSGKILCRATTAWLPFNTKTKRITGMQNLPVKIPYRPDLIAVDEYPSKIISSGVKEILFSKKFRYSDLDINHHVNNVKYVEMILDSFSLSSYKLQSIGNITVAFLSESFYDDEVEVRLLNSSGEKSVLVEGINIKTQKQVFASQLNWR